MFNIIDTILLIAFAVFFYTGWRRGFFKSIIGPISLIVAGFLSYYYYFSENNIFMSLAVGILGPMVISIVLNLIVGLWGKSKDEDGKRKLSPVSKFMGAILSFAWRAPMLILLFLGITILPLDIIPLKVEALEKVQNQITNSYSYNTLKNVIGPNRVYTSTDIVNVSETMQDPKKLEKLQTSPHFKKVMSNQRMNEFLNDDDVLQDIEDKNISKLMKDPRIMDIMQDPELLKSLMALNKEMLDESKE